MTGRDETRSRTDAAGEFAERERMLWFWLSDACEMSAGEMHRIREMLYSPEDITQMSAARITEICGIAAPRAAQIAGAAGGLERSKEKYLKMTERGVRMITFYDEGFPDRLRLIPDPPFLLYVKGGGLPDTFEPAAAVVGSRRCSDYGIYTTERIAEELAAAGCHIISGLASGIDACAHRGALRAKGKTTAVMGCGIDRCYPAENYALYRGILESGGAVISEYPPGVQALPWHFPVRNRIISGLADCVLVMEAREKSGTQITVSYALDQGRDVFALPGRLGDSGSAGCLGMIRDGAQILTGTDQVLEALSLRGFLFGGAPDRKRLRESGEDEGENSRNIALDNEEKQVYSALSNDPVTLDELLERTKLPPSALHRALISLELDGILFRSDQGTYYRKRQL